MKCPICNYEWKNKKQNPVSCPRCKRRFDYLNNIPKIVKKKFEKGLRYLFK